MIYYTRYGDIVVPEADSKRRARRGIFAILVENDHLLLTWQHNAIDTPQLPGGGIEEGEDMFHALAREIHEEAGMEVSPDLLATGEMHEQLIGYYADDQQEFWDYHQNFVFLKDAGLFFNGEKKSPENGAALWVRLDDLNRHRLQAMHKRGIDHFLDRM